MSNETEKDSVLSEQDQYELDETSYQEQLSESEREAYEYEARHGMINDQKLDERKENPRSRHTASDF